MNKDVLSFTNIEINHELLNEIWKLDPKKLEHIDGMKLSTYALCLAQYLIYFTYQRNLSKAEQHRLNKYIDRTVSIIMMTSNDEDIKKKYKTKSAAADFIISTNLDLMDAQSKLETLQQELIQVEGMDKTVSELIATIKRELTRRENELYQVRMERRN